MRFARLHCQSASNNFHFFCLLRAMFEAIGVIPCFQDVAMMSNPVQGRRAALFRPTELNHHKDFKGFETNCLFEFGRIYLQNVN